MRADSNGNGHHGANGTTSSRAPSGGRTSRAERGVVPAGMVNGDAAATPPAPPDDERDETRVSGRPDRPVITVPGLHVVEGRRRIRRGVDTFCNLVLDKLPLDLLYNSSGTVGMLSPHRISGDLTFDPLETADVEYLVDQHTQLRTWVFTGRRPRAKFVNCNSRLAKVIGARAKRHPAARLLTRIVQYPVYAPTMERYPEGWSPDGTYFDCPSTLLNLDPEMDESVIREVLEDLVVDFPFRDESDRQNFYGQLLTPLLRPALNGNVPLHMVLASMPRTGKSKLIEEVWGGVILGRPTPAQPVTGDDAELDKRIVSMLMIGDTLIHLDNLPGSIDSPVLASLLTAGEYQGRELGKSLILRMKNTLILAASGNNTKATEEIAKRTVPIRLQPQDEHPENRVGFVHPDIREYVREVRPAVLACLLGMIERWKAQGRPSGKKPMGGFEAWARVVGGVMAANGFTEWMSNADEWRRQSDPETDDVRALITEWAREHGRRQLAASALVEVARAFGLFAGVLDKKKEAANLSAFSRAVLGRYQDRPFMGLRIVRSASGNNTKYQLEGDDDAFRIVSALPPRERVAGHSDAQGEIPDFT